MEHLNEVVGNPQNISRPGIFCGQRRRHRQARPGQRIGNGGHRGTNFPSAHFSNEAVTRR
jgi:hypothetical protein